MEYRSNLPPPDEDEDSSRFEMDCGWTIPLLLLPLDPSSGLTPFGPRRMTVGSAARAENVLKAMIVDRIARNLMAMDMLTFVVTFGNSRGK